VFTDKSTENAAFMIESERISFQMNFAIASLYFTSRTKSNQLLIASRITCF